MITVRIIRGGQKIYWRAKSRAALDDAIAAEMMDTGKMFLTDQVGDLPSGCQRTREPHDGVVEFIQLKGVDTPNAHHQRSYRQRQSDSGKREVRVWVDECNVETVKDFAKEL